MRSLIIGSDSFSGSFLWKYLEKDVVQELYGTTTAKQADGCNDHIFCMDLTDRASITAILQQVRPQRIFVLTGIDSDAYGWDRPEQMIDIHVKGTLNLLDAVRECELDATILFAGSAEEYGRVGFDELPIREEHPVNPTNVFAVSKVGQNQMANLYQRTFKMKIVIARSFSETGPGQSERFVLPDICRQIVQIERGQQENKLTMSNQNIMRDFTDVRDTVRGFALLADKGIPGEIYNVGSGKTHAVRDIIRLALRHSEVKPEIVTGDEFLRRVDMPVLQACNKKIHLATGWTPTIPLEQTVEDVLNYYRAQYVM